MIFNSAGKTRDVCDVIVIAFFGVILSNTVLSGFISKVLLLLQAVLEGTVLAQVTE